MEKVGGWLMSLVVLYMDEKVEENEAVGMSCCELGWVGGRRRRKVV